MPPIPESAKCCSFEVIPVEMKQSKNYIVIDIVEHLYKNSNIINVFSFYYLCNVSFLNNYFTNSLFKLMLE